MGATFGSLFAGIGGIDLGLERAGWDCRFQVEWNPFCQRVLAKHWPDVPRYGDIRDVHGPLAHADAGYFYPNETLPAGRHLAGIGCGNCLPRVDLLAGGFPCQPVSFAGRRAITDDDRWLWPEFARTIRELRPRYVLVENVPGLLVGGGMDEVLGGLAELGYDTEWESIPAAAVGAPHLRYRVWIIGYRMEDANRRTVEPGRWRRRIAEAGELADSEGEGLQGWEDRRDTGPPLTGPWEGSWTISDQWSTEPNVGRVAHGVPARVDRLRSLGNAVVPQVVEFLGRRILKAEEVA